MRNNLLPVMVEPARDIPEAWFYLLRSILNNGRTYLVEEGSRAGDTRLTLDCMGYIEHPEYVPMSPMPKPGLSSPTSEQSIKDYFEDYLLSIEGPPGSKADYVYGKWLSPMYSWVARYLTKWGPNQAHCSLRVGEPFDVLGYDKDYNIDCPNCKQDSINPECVTCFGTGKMKDDTQRITTPCLVNMAFQIVPSDNIYYLKQHITYRSWDCTNGFVENMGGFQLVKKLIYDLMVMHGNNYSWLPKNAKFVLGPSTYRSWDLHIYGADLDSAKAWAGME